MTHDDMDQLYDLYIMGALEPELASEIDQHLGDECAYCREHLQDATMLTAALAGIAGSQKAPKALRARVLRSVAPPKRAGSWVFAIGALSAATLALLVFSLWSTRAVENMRAQMSALSVERDELRLAVQTLSRPQTRTVEFGRAENVPHGRVFVNRTGGVVFVGSNLPKLASNRTFELWVIPPGGAPLPAGLFRPGAAGDSVHVSPASANPAQISAVAVSVEPLEGSSSPTTTPIIVVPVG